MPHSLRHGLAALAILAGAGCGLASGTAQAQMMGMHNNPNAGGNKAPVQPPPPSLPGSKPAGSTPVAPADKSVADMQPNDALFDAINRGDVAAARDALSRGAQLESHNVLGMTPLELSVDLGRNEISFLLLSMRGPVDSSAVISVPTSRPQQAGAGSGRHGRHHTAGASDETATVTGTQSKKPGAADAADAADGGAGTGSSQSGFLGFGR